MERKTGRFFIKESLFSRRILWALFLLLSYSFTVVAQQKYTYSGVVKDESGVTLPGVYVTVNGDATAGVVTDFAGAFTLTSEKASLELKFSSVGYETVTQTFEPSENIVVILKEANIKLNEVVVVGYGTQKKSLVTGSISKVETNDIVDLPHARADQAIQGQTSGVNVLSTSGSPGAGTQIRIRGVNSNGSSNPLFIVDGMKTGDINDVDPSDIASIEVLKDAASAAIYGTEGSNGVILITTKSGKAGKTKISYDTQYGIQSARSDTKMMNASQYLQWMSETGNVLTNTGVNTNWLDEIFENAPMQRHHLSMSGGKDKTTYMFSTSLYDQDGIVGGEKANYNRISTRLNFKTEVKKWLEIGVNISYQHSNQKYIDQDNEYRGAVNSALLMDPLTPTVYTNTLPAFVQSLIDAGNTLVTNSDGNYYGLPEYVTGEIVNPLALIDIYHNKIKQDKLLSTAYVNLKLFKGLQFTSRFGYELTNQSNHSWNPEYYFSAESQNTVTTIDDNLNKWNRWLWENFITYNKSFGDHNITALLGYSAEDQQSYWYYLHSGPMIGEGDQYSYHTYTTSRDFDKVGSTFGHQTMISSFARLNYSFKDKYMLEASLRRDAASVFPTENRAGYFPSVSAGWIISQEDFFNVPMISYFKLRASWGQNGSKANLPGNEDKEFWVFSGIEYPDATDNFQSGSHIDKLVNTDLQWERTQMTDIGIDLRLLDDKLSLTLDVYDKLTKNLIVQGTGPLSIGNSFPNINGGDISNKGLDIDLGYRDFSHALKYSVNLNFSTFDNNVERLAVNAPVPGANVRGYNLTWFEEGYPIWYFKGYNITGIDPDNGDPIVEDVDGDGSITAADQTYIGDPYADFTYGANIYLSYKNFDFNVLIQGSQGNDVFMGWFRSDRPFSNKPEFFFTDRWTSGNTNATMPAANNTSDYVYRSSLMVQDASFLRIRQIQLGYTLPEDLFNGYIKGSRVYIALDDYFTFTKYPGLNPEAGSYNPTSQGVDRGIYPLAGKILFGLSLKF